MKNNILKLVVIIFCVTAIICAFIVSQDKCHLETCHDEHCVICAMIQVAQNIVNLSIAIVLIVMIGVFIYYFLSRLHKDRKVFEVISLIFLKVQFNE